MPIDPKAALAELEQAKLRLEELRAIKDANQIRERLNHINRGLCWLEFFLEEQRFKR